jgi:hypothetical protein
MSTRTIPARTEVICDLCQVVLDNNTSGAGGVTVNFPATGLGPAQIFDLCDRHAGLLRDWLTSQEVSAGPGRSTFDDVVGHDDVS